jgi:hypothetical protein
MHAIKWICILKILTFVSFAKARAFFSRKLARKQPSPRFLVSVTMKVMVVKRVRKEEGGRKTEEVRRKEEEGEDCRTESTRTEGPTN